MVVENLYTKDCIRTYSGIYMNVFEPTLDMICIEDIAHALSMQCRFGGHLQTFFSVAQHSLNCSYLVDEKYKLPALLHDASEAYLLDIPRPIKNRLSNYKEIEDTLMILIAEKFEFTYPLDKEVKDIDEQMLRTEWDCLMLKKYVWNLPSYDVHTTKTNFLSMFKYYKTISQPVHTQQETDNWDESMDN